MRIPADYFWAWLIPQGSKQQLAARLEGCMGLSNYTWERWIQRRARTIKLSRLDAILCWLDGPHLSMFDPYYRESA